MLNRFCSEAARSPAAIDELLAREAIDPEAREDFSRPPGDEIEPLIACCEAPALLWRKEPPPLGDPSRSE